MKNLLYIILGLGLSLSLYSCASADKMLENGNYDGLVNLAVNKLSGKKKKEVYVTALEEGFEKITRHDMARIESLRYSNRAEDWEAIIPIARDMQKRQERIEPLLPLVSETGYRAKFTFVQTDKIIAEAKATSVSLYENRLGDMVTAARNANKKSAREAYDLINHIRSIGDKYYRADLRDEMWALGINKILIRVENNSNMFIPAGLEDELLSSNFYNEKGSWDRFYTDINEDMQIDYQVILKIQDIDVSRDEWPSC